MLVNIIKSYREVVAICDSELLGKCFEEGIFQLDIKESFYKGEQKAGNFLTTNKGGETNSSSYPKGHKGKSQIKGEKKTEQEVIQIIKDMKSEDATFNIVGEKSVNCAVKAGLISKDSIKTIQGIPFALVLM